MGKSSTDSVNAIVRTIINICINILVIAIVIMIIVSYSGKAYEFGKSLFDEQAMTTEENAKSVVVTIPKNASSSEIAQIIEDEGLVEDKNIFLVKLLLSEYKDEIQPGTYTVSTASTPTDIMKQLCEVSSEEEGEDTK